ncbi:MAG: glycosylase [Planctomycetia bacterium]|nr:glycosylase [Planctomycetia bacterium]
MILPKAPKSLLDRLLTVCRKAWWIACWLSLLGVAAVAAEPKGSKLPMAPAAVAPEFPAELVKFSPYEHNPIFTAEGPGHWDVKIRERGWILRERDQWRMWYTGYDGKRESIKQLGAATSADGLKWQPDANNPIYRQHWVEDMMVVHQGDTYYMFAEGKDDQAHWLTSPDGLQWTRQGVLDIRRTNGQPIPPGPYGTPTAWCEGGTWYLLYERGDRAVWLARTADLKTWTHVQDEPVLTPGPDAYDREAIAVNQVIRYAGRYYAYYHGTGQKTAPRQWTTNIAMSTDRVHWKKYAGNPIAPGDVSSGIVVETAPGQFRLYTMHDAVRAFMPSR